MTRQVIECDQCKRTFRTDNAKVHTEQLTYGRTGYFFRCPMCNKKYPFASVSEQGLVFLPELQKQRKEIAAEKNPIRRERLDKKYVKLLALYKQEVNGPYQEAEVLSNGG